jgi:DNA-binding SARP family transcriptional activator
VVDRFAPSLAADQEFRTWHQRYERHAADSDSLRDLLDLGVEMDVREVLPTLDVPTLVLHRTGDQIVPVELGRELAAAIPGARIVEEDSNDHFAYVGDLDPWMTEIERFVTGANVERTSTLPSRPTVRITTLGDFSVVVDGEAVPKTAWGSRLARQLCKRLVAARGAPVTRDELIDLLWPDEHDRRKLSARLSVQLSTVRRILGGGVEADRESVRLDLGEVATDLEAFHAAVDDAAIVAAYTGEFLPDDLYEDWTGSTRDEARLRFVTAARRQAERTLAAGNPAQATALARRLVATDRYDDASHRLLISALLAGNETGAALRAHEDWTAAMGELDIAVPPFDALS